MFSSTPDRASDIGRHLQQQTQGPHKLEEVHGVCSSSPPGDCQSASKLAHLEGLLCPRATGSNHQEPEDHRVQIEVWEWGRGLLTQPGGIRQGFWEKITLMLRPKRWVRGREGRRSFSKKNAWEVQCWVLRKGRGKASSLFLALSLLWRLPGLVLL